VRGKGIANFAEALALRERSWAKDCSPWFCLICSAKARAAKKPFCKKAFLATFVTTNGVAFLSAYKKINNCEKRD
jgi:hypothetical protein